MTISNDQRKAILQLRRIGHTQDGIAELADTSRSTVKRTLSDKKRVVVIADLHCGHRVGLTPPKWQWDTDNSFQSKWAAQQKEVWNWYINRMKTLQPIDYLVVNGDSIDGKGTKSGSTELITADRNEQVGMARECIKQAHAPKILLTRGTGYHTGIGEDWEDSLKERLSEDALVEIHDHAFPKIEGIQFSIKHFSGGSSIPHGRLTSLARSAMWNKIWASEREQQPHVNIFIRSHVHYYANCGGRNWHAFSTPTLQGWGSKFGQLKCEGKVDTGMMWFDIPKGADCLDDITWQKDIPDFGCQKVEVKQW